METQKIEVIVQLRHWKSFLRYTEHWTMKFQKKRIWEQESRWRQEVPVTECQSLHCKMKFRTNLIMEVLWLSKFGMLHRVINRWELIDIQWIYYYHKQIVFPFKAFNWIVMSTLDHHCPWCHYYRPVRINWWIFWPFCWRIFDASTRFHYFFNGYIQEQK